MRLIDVIAFFSIKERERMRESVREKEGRRVEGMERESRRRRRSRGEGG